MTQTKIRLGIIGANTNYGWGGRAHLPAIAHLPEYELVAVCNARLETAEEAAKQYGAPLAFRSHQDMLSHADIDAVAVVVRVPLHHRLTMDALNAGKHVLTEWPLGANLQEAQELADLARVRGVHTMVGHQHRFSPVYLRLKELLDEGYVGEVLSCHLTQVLPGVLGRVSRRTWQGDSSLGANTLTVTFGHSVDCLSMCVGDFSEVSALLSTQVPQWQETDTGRMVDVTAPDNILVSGKLASGAVASVHVSTVPWHGGTRLEIYGRNGTLVASVSMTTFTDTVRVRLGEPFNVRLEGATSTERHLREIPIPGRLSYVPDGVPLGEPFNVARMYRAFAEAISTDRRVEPDFETAVACHRLLKAVQDASEKGRRMKLAPL